MSFTGRHCGAHLEPVLETLRRMKKRGIWVEVTTLVIPTLNDDEGELREIAAFIRSLGDGRPLARQPLLPAIQRAEPSPDAGKDHRPGPGDRP